MASEAEHYAQIQLAFKSYSGYHLCKLRKHYSDYSKLSREQQGMLGGYVRRLDEVGECIKRNQRVLDMLVDEGEETGASSLEDADARMESIRSLLRQMVRDWAKEGGGSVSSTR